MCCGFRAGEGTKGKGEEIEVQKKGEIGWQGRKEVELKIGRNAMERCRSSAARYDRHRSRKLGECFKP